MNFKINNKGLGIVEVLVASFIGLILVGALTKSSMSQLHFYNAIQSLYDEQDLAYSMGEVLTNDLSCKANLKPSHLNNGDTTALVQGLGDPDVQDMSLVTAGTKFKSLSIVKINLSGSGDPETQTVSRDLTVFFTRKGSFNTRNNNPCTASNTSGCYATKCVLKYRVSSSDVTVCDVQTCAGIKGGSNLSGKLCNSGEYLRGFSSNGNKICETLPVSQIVTNNQNSPPARQPAQQPESPPEQQPEQQPESPPEQQPEQSPSMARPDLPKTPECMRLRRTWPRGPVAWTGEYSANCGSCVPTVVIVGAFSATIDIVANGLIVCAHVHSNLMVNDPRPIVTLLS